MVLPFENQKFIYCFNKTKIVKNLEFCVYKKINVNKNNEHRMLGKIKCMCLFNKHKFLNQF